MVVGTLGLNHKCSMCRDDPDITCTCTKGSNNSYAQTITINQYPEDKVDRVGVLERPKKKKRLSRIQKQAMYGGAK